MSNKRPRLGEILVNSGIISEQQLRSGLAYQNQWGVQLGEALITKGFISEVDLLKVLAKQLQLPAVNLAKTFISQETLKHIKVGFAEKYSVIPLAKRIEKGQEILLVATSNPTNLTLLDEIRFMVTLPVKFVIATKSSIIKAIKKFYMNERVNFAEGSDDRISKIKQMKEEDLIVLKNNKRSVAEQYSKSSKKTVGGEIYEKTGVSKEFQALLKLLIKKGLISRNEFINELKKLSM